MDRQAIIKQLEGLQEHCESMIDKDDPECIWRSDAEALAEAIKALGSDIDKNQKGNMDMTSEVKVTFIGVRQKRTFAFALAISQRKGGVI